jgi:hypothetical protein
MIRRGTRARYHAHARQPRRFDPVQHGAMRSR